MMRRGAFITIEGGDGAGKTTQLESICDYLDNSGITFITTREPGGTPLAEHLRDLILHPGAFSIEDVATEVMLMFSARMHHLNTKILPALDEGVWVISDRFTDSTVAYQGFGSGFDVERILEIADIVHGGHWPDLSILLDIPIEIGAARRDTRAEVVDRFETEHAEFQQRVREGYLMMANRFPERIKIIDAVKELSEVNREVITELVMFREKWEEV